MASSIKKIIFVLKDPKFLYVLATIIFVSGIINYMIEGSSLSPTMIYARSLRFQSLVETIIYIFVTVFGLSGTFLLLRIGNQRSKRLATLYFMIGIMILLIASLLPYWIWWSKLY